MEINITKFFKEAEPMNYSASVAEYGDNAGKITWSNAIQAANEYNYLDDEEKRQAFRDYVECFGAWSVEEIAAWPDNEVNALFIQFVSSGMRESGLDEFPFDEIDWSQYQEGVEKGAYTGNIYKGDDGEIYYYIGY